MPRRILVSLYNAFDLRRIDQIVQLFETARRAFIDHIQIDFEPLAAVDAHDVCGHRATLRIAIVQGLLDVRASRKRIGDGERCGEPADPCASEEDVDRRRHRRLQV
jgi:hypothetical protein